MSAHDGDARGSTWTSVGQVLGSMGVEISARLVGRCLCGMSSELVADDPDLHLACEGKRRCARCKTVHQLEAFPFVKRARGWRNRTCRTCLRVPRRKAMARWHARRRWQWPPPSPPEVRRPAHRAPRTLEHFAEGYFAVYAEPTKSPRAVAAERALLRRHLVPLLGRCRVDGIGPGDVLRLRAALVDHPRVGRLRVGRDRRAHGLVCSRGSKPQPRAASIM